MLVSSYKMLETCYQFVKTGSLKEVLNTQNCVSNMLKRCVRKIKTC